MKNVFSVFCVMALSCSPQPCDAATVFDFQNTDGFKFTNYCNNLSIGLGYHEGERALVIKNEFKDDKYHDTYWSFTTPRFAARAGKTFAVKIRSRSDISLKNTSPSSAVLWYAEGGRPLLAQDVLGQDSQVTTPIYVRTSSTEYRTAVMTGVVPEGAAFASVRMCADAPDIRNGQVVAVSRVEYVEREDGAPWEYDDLTPPKVERITPSPNPDFSASVSFRISDPSGIGKVSVSLDGADVTERVTFSKDIITYRPSAPWAEDSIHEFVFSVEDGRGNDGSVSRFICFTRGKVMHEKVTIRDDGVLLCDGRPFFPIGIQGVRPQPINGDSMDRAVKDLKDAGFNLLSTFSLLQDGSGRALAAACEREGIKIKLAPGPRKRKNRDSIMRKTVFEGRSRPSVFSWSIGDDTSANRTPEEVARDYDLVHAVDPDVITDHADGSSVSGPLAGYAPWTDMFICELYPMRKAKAEPHELAQLQKHIGIAYGDLRSGGAPAPCVVPVVQAFSGFHHWKRFPTPEEIRAMTFLAIACRARGVRYYLYLSVPEKGNYGIASTPERFAAVTNITHEVSVLSPKLLTRDAAMQPSVRVTEGPQKASFGFPSVTALLKECGLLVAVNISTEPVKAVLSLPDGRSQKVSLVRNGVFVGQFGQGAK